MRCRQIDLAMLGITAYILLIAYLWISGFLLNETESLAISTSTASTSLKYALVVDAGSSGSRLFVYCLQSVDQVSKAMPRVTLCKDSLGNVLTKKVTPGISSFSNNASTLESYVVNLLQVASLHVPKSLHPSTPLFMFATAGMRLLSEGQQTEIWEAVRQTIRQRFTFQFTDSSARTVSGLYEALYGWISVNYLLGKFSDNSSSTAGMLDMGGASMQIAYELPSSSPVSANSVMDFKFGDGNLIPSKLYRVYVMTFLSYGTQATKSRHKLKLLKDAMLFSDAAALLRVRFHQSVGKIKGGNLTRSQVRIVNEIGGSEKFFISDPCLQPGLEDALTSKDLLLSHTLSPILKSASIPTVLFEGTGNLTSCLALQKRLLNKNSPCEQAPCSMNGVHQPPIDFAKVNFYGMSEYWYTSSNLIKNMESYGFSAFHRLANTTCSTPWQVSLTNLTDNLDRVPDMTNRQNLCFKASWIMNVLHAGFGFPADYVNLRVVDKLDGIEVQWSLGALIYHLLQSSSDSLLEDVSSTKGATFSHLIAALLLAAFCVCCIVLMIMLCRRSFPCAKLLYRSCLSRLPSCLMRTPSKPYQYSRLDSPSSDVSYFSGVVTHPNRLEPDLQSTSSFRENIRQSSSLPVLGDVPFSRFVRM